MNLSFRTVVPTLLALLLATALTACGRDKETPTSTPPPAVTSAPAVVPTDTPAPAAVPTDTPVPAAQPESPLGQPESPLGQPESPLGQPDSPLTTINGKEITANPARPLDRAALVSLVNATTAPVPQDGMAAVSAVLFSYAFNSPIVTTYFYLTPAAVVDGTPVPEIAIYGPRPDKGDVGGNTNEQGQLMLDNVPPGDYFMLVSSFYDWPAAFNSPDDWMPALISVQAGQQLDLGLLYVNWP